ncbi:MAG: carbohydrate kinase family protein [Alphaproteobacteria bacterium]
MTKKIVVVGMGELLWDIFLTGKKAGGAPINFVYHASQLGAKGYAISAIGSDALGEEIVSELHKNKILAFLEKVDFPTGTVNVKLDSKGMPTYEIVEDVAWDYIPLTDKAIEIVQRADAICYGTLALRNDFSRKTILTLLSFASEKAYKYFDINLRLNYYSKELIHELLSYSNVFKINDEEMVVVKKLFGLEGTDEEICKYFIEKYKLKFLLFTAGEKYSIVYSGKEKSYLETPKVKVVDTVGAGDAFSGAFLCAIIKGMSIEKAHEYAVKVSAFVCTKQGAWPTYDRDVILL